MLSADADVNDKTEIDPTQKKARTSGRSPTNILVSTLSDALTLDFAKTLIAAESIGEDDVTDYLSVSFPATDYLGLGAPSVHE